MTNLYQFATLPDKGSEIFETLFENKSVRIERILSSELNNGEWYDQQGDEWVALLEGEAVMELDGSRLSLKKGDTLVIPKHTPHRVIETSENTLWLAVHINS